MKSEIYEMSHEAKINKNCKVEFNKRKNGQLHIRVATFGKNNVTVNEETLNEIFDLYLEYKKGNYEREA